MKSRLVNVTVVDIQNVLTRTTGFLKTVTSHSLQPYRGCSFGRSLCGVGCYVQHNYWVTKGRDWGGFLEIRQNAAEAYQSSVDAERRWAKKSHGRFSIFMSSSTDPFLPQEARYGVSESLLDAMIASPPDLLILQTHTHRVCDHAEQIQRLADQCEVRVHLSIETDCEEIPGLPPHASPVEARFEAAETMKTRGVRVVVTVSPLLPIQDPDGFFERIGRSADAVVIDHFIEGDGSREGQRTLGTPLPSAIGKLNPDAITLEYRDAMAECASRYMPGCVGVSKEGFAGRYAIGDNNQKWKIKGGATA